MTENAYIDCGSCVNLMIYSDKHGMLVFTIDKEDEENVRQHKWVIQKCTHTDSPFPKYYARTSNSAGILLHRYIMCAKKGEVVDHINQNTFDTRKANLRCTTYSVNNFNTRLKRRNKTGYAGVYYVKSSKKWHAYISRDRRRHSLGYFSTKEEAVVARKEAERVYYADVLNDTEGES